MRDVRLDLLRILGIIAVVCIHTFCVLDYAVYPQYRTIGLVLNTLCHYAVPLFVMVSGIVLMDRCDGPLASFYWKRLTRIGFPLAPCVVFFVLLRVFRDGDSVALVLKETVMGRPYYHLWFAFMLIGVSLFLPLIVRLVEEINNLMLLIACGLFIYVAWRGGEGPYQIIPYVAYAMIGMIIYRRYGNGNHRLEGLLAFVLCAILSVVNARLVQRTESFWTIGYSSPFILVGASSLMVAYLALWPRFTSTSIVRLARLTFAVYLWHPVMKGIATVVSDRFPWMTFHAWLVFPLTAVLSFGLVWIFSCLPVGAAWLGVKERSVPGTQGKL